MCKGDLVWNNSRTLTQGHGSHLFCRGNHEYRGNFNDRMVPVEGVLFCESSPLAVLNWSSCGGGLILVTNYCTAMAKLPVHEVKVVVPGFPSGSWRGLWVSHLLLAGLVQVVSLKFDYCPTKSYVGANHETPPSMISNTTYKKTQGRGRSTVGSQKDAWLPIPHPCPHMTGERWEFHWPTKSDSIGNEP